MERRSIFAFRARSASGFAMVIRRSSSAADTITTGCSTGARATRSATLHRRSIRPADAASTCSTTNQASSFTAEITWTRRQVGTVAEKSTANRQASRLKRSTFPDAPNQSSFPTTVLRPGQMFQSQTMFRFSAPAGAKLMENAWSTSRSLIPACARRGSAWAPGPSAAGCGAEPKNRKPSPPSTPRSTAASRWSTPRAVYGYGSSEEIVGKALAGRAPRASGHREKVDLDWTDDGSVFRNADQSAHRKRDRSIRCGACRPITSTSIRCIGPTRSTPIEETAGAMKALLDAGKIRAIGVSNYSAAQMDVFVLLRRCIPRSRRYNLFERDARARCCRIAPSTASRYDLRRAVPRTAERAVTRERAFKGDDLRGRDPKYPPPRFPQYLAAVDRARRARARALSASGSSISRCAGCSNRGSRHRAVGRAQAAQLDDVEGAMGWSRSIARRAGGNRSNSGATIPDPVGPEFMAPRRAAPPSARGRPRLASGQPAIRSRSHPFE